MDTMLDCFVEEVYVMENQEFTIYTEKDICLNGRISEGCLHLESYVSGDGYSSEKYYDLSKSESDKLFSLISLEEFVELCKKEHLVGVEEFFKKNDIEVQTYVW